MALASGHTTNFALAPVFAPGGIAKAIVNKFEHQIQFITLVAHKSGLKRVHKIGLFNRPLRPAGGGDADAVLGDRTERRALLSGGTSPQLMA